MLDVLMCGAEGVYSMLAVLCRFGVGSDAASSTGADSMDHRWLRTCRIELTL